MPVDVSLLLQLLRLLPWSLRYLLRRGENRRLFLAVLRRVVQEHVPGAEQRAILAVLFRDSGRGLLRGLGRDRRATLQGEVRDEFHSRGLWWDSVTAEKFARLTDDVAELQAAYLGTAAEAAIAASVAENLSATRGLGGRLAHIEPVLASLAKSGAAQGPEFAPEHAYLGLPVLSAHKSLRATTVATLASTLDSRVWLHIHGPVGSGKTYLAALVTGRYRSPVWVDGLGATSDVGETIARLEVGLAATSRARRGPDLTTYVDDSLRELTATGPTLLVIDDIGRFDSDRWNRVLLILIETAERYGARLLSTGPVVVPVGLRAEAGARLIEVQAPELSDQDAREILLDQGMPDHLIGKVSFLNALSSGHPAMLTSVGAYLSESGWSFSERVLKRVISGDLGDDNRLHTIRRLVTTVSSASARTLLYRLSIVAPPLREQDVLTVASVEPQVQRPLEEFSSVEGLWVQRLGEDSYRLAPVFQRAGQGHLSKGEQVAVHRAITDALLAKRRLDHRDVLRGVNSFMGADNPNGAGWMLGSALNALKETETEEGALRRGVLFPLFWASGELPAAMDIVLRMHIRVQQFRVFKSWGDDVEFLARDIFHLHSSVPPGEGLALLTPIGSLIDLAEVDLREALALVNRIYRRMDEPLLQDTGDRDVLLSQHPELRVVLDRMTGAMPWLLSTSVTNLDDAFLLFDALEAAPERIRKVAAEDPISSEAMRLLVERCWLTADDRQADWRDYSVLLARLTDKLLSLGLVSQAAWVIGGRVRVHAQNLDELEAARALAAEGLALTQEHAPSRFALHYRLGEQLLRAGAYKEAASSLSEGLCWAGDAQALAVVDARMVLARALSLDADWYAGSESIRRAVDDLEQSGDDDTLYFVRILGEYMVAAVKAGNGPRAYSVGERAVRLLLELRDDSTEWKRVAVVLGNVLARLLPETGSGTGEAFAGIMFSEEPGIEQFFDEQRVALLPSLLVRTARAAGEPRQAGAWALTHVEAACASGNTVDLACLDVALAELVEAGDHHRAEHLALCGALHSALRESGIPMDCAHRLPAMTTDERKTVTNHLIALYYLPALLDVLSQKLKGTDVSQSVETALALARHRAGHGLQVDVMNRGINILAEARTSRLDAQRVLRSDLAVMDTASTRAMAIALASLDTKLAPESARDLQAEMHRLLHQWIAVCPVSYEAHLVPFVEQYWRHRLQHAPFRFRSPMATKAVLDEVALLHPSERLPHLLTKIV